MKAIIRIVLAVFICLSLYVPAISQDGIIKDFSATGEGRAVYLEWSTENEIDVVEFRIQRSFDGRQYYLLDQVHPHGANSAYSYLDNDLFKNNNHTVYYRIEVLLTGKRTQFSPVSQTTISYSDIHRTWGSIKAMFK